MYCESHSCEIVFARHEVHGNGLVPEEMSLHTDERSCTMSTRASGTSLGGIAGDPPDLAHKADRYRAVKCCARAIARIRKVLCQDSRTRCDLCVWTPTNDLIARSAIRSANRPRPPAEASTSVCPELAMTIAKQNAPPALAPFLVHELQLCGGKHARKATSHCA